MSDLRIGLTPPLLENVTDGPPGDRCTGFDAWKRIGASR